MTRTVSQEPASDGAEPASGAKRIQSVDRAIALLKHVVAAERPQPVADLAAATGLNRSTAWRLLMTLEYHGLIERDPGTQDYVPGHELLQLAGTHPTRELLRVRARPVLDRLAHATAETINLMVPTAGGLMSVDQWDAPSIAMMNLAGIQLPLHATASGKLRLALARPGELELLLPDRLQRFTPDTIDDRDALLAELDRIRKRGYALECDEFETGVSGVAAPILSRSGDALAFTSCWGLTVRLPAARLKSLANALQSAAEEIGAALAAGSREV